MTRVEVELVDDLGTVLGKSERELAHDLRVGGALRWYAEGRISRRQAMTFAGVSDEEFRAALRSLGGVAADSLTAGDEAGQHRQRPSDDAGPPIPDFRLLLLGSPVVYRISPDGDGTEADWRLHKAFESVAFLAVAPGQRASRDELVEAVWQDVDPEAVRKNFHPTLSEARRALRSRDAIRFHQKSYILNPDKIWDVDVVEFEHLAAAGRDLEVRMAEPDGAPAPVGEAERRALKPWRRAWELYRGPFLAGRESLWVAARREDLRRTYLRVLRNVAWAAGRLGLDTLALDACRSVLVEEPYEESSHLAMMELFARQGRRDLVLRQYSRLQEVLQQELGEEPRVETQERYHDLMRKR